MEPAALDHLGVEVPLDGVGPLAKVVDLLGGRAGRLRGRSTARKSQFRCDKKVIDNVHNNENHLISGPVLAGGPTRETPGPTRLVGPISRTRQVPLPQLAEPESSIKAGPD